MIGWPHSEASACRADIPINRRPGGLGRDAVAELLAGPMEES